MSKTTYNLKTFKQLEKTFLRARLKVVRRWTKHIKQELDPFYDDVKVSDRSNQAGDFYFIFTLTKGKYEIEMSVEDGNCGRDDYAIRAFAYDELPENIENQLTYVEEEDFCIFKSTKLEKVLIFLVELSKKFDKELKK